MLSMNYSTRPVSDLAVDGKGSPAKRRFGADSVIRYTPLILLGTVSVILAVSVPYFLTTGNVVNVLVQASGLGLMAIGMTAVLIVGGIDLSVPSIMALSGILGTMYMRAGGNPVLAGLLIVLAATLAGSINGCAVAYLRMIPFVVTLSMMAIAEGASIWVTRATSVTGVHPSFTDTILARVWGVPLPVIVLFAATAGIQLLMRRSLFGRWLYATGTNVRTARVSGVPTGKVVFGAYVFSGFFAGLTAVLMTARFASASATMGQSSVVLDIVSSAVVGGVSIYGGVGSALGAVAGAVLITVINNAMNLLQVSYYTTLWVKGLVIVLFVALDSLRRR